MKKVKRSEVPKDYRRNYKKEAVELLKMFAFSFLFAIFVVWMVELA